MDGGELAGTLLTSVTPTPRRAARGRTARTDPLLSLADSSPALPSATWGAREVKRVETLLARNAEQDKPAPGEELFPEGYAAALEQQLSPS